MQPAIAGDTPVVHAAQLTIIFHTCEEGGYTAESIEIPGCVSQGETEAEAKKNIKDAINACLSVLFEDYILRLRNSVDLAAVNLEKVSRQERLLVSVPRVALPSYA